MTLSDIESILDYDDDAMEIFHTTLPIDTIDNSFDIGLFDDEPMLLDDLMNIEGQTDDEELEEEDYDDYDYDPQLVS